MSIRYIEIKNDELKKLIEQKGELTGEGRAIYEKMEALQAEAMIVGGRVQEIKDQIIPMTGEELKDEEMGEFEVAGSTDIEDGVVRVSIIDELEAFKEKKKEVLAEAKRKEDGELTEEEEIAQIQGELLQKLQEVDQKDVKEVIQKLVAVLDGDK